jgi:hypothetical protein
MDQPDEGEVVSGLVGEIWQTGYNRSVLDRCGNTGPALTTAPVQEETVAPTKLNPSGEGPQSLRRFPVRSTLEGRELDNAQRKR